MATIDAAKKTVVFNGDREELNNAFGAVYDNIEVPQYFDEELSAEEMPAAVGERLSLNADSLAAYASRNALPKEAVKLMEAEMTCNTLYYASTY